jgi:hypothetical protein
MKLRLPLAMILLFTAAHSMADSHEEQELGLLLNTGEAFEGYNLFAPLDASTTYLFDNEGRVVRTWESDYRPGNLGYLLENGNLLRAASFGHDGNGVFFGGGAGYRIEEFTWDGDRIWEWIYASDDHLMHHDIEPMPNGNVLMIAWEMNTKEEAIAAGRDPEMLKDDELWSLHVIEVKPEYPDGGKIVWEWHLMDHVIQDIDEAKNNYGDVAAHPELVDINPPGLWMERLSDEEAEQLRALGYLGDDPEDEGQDDDDEDERGGGADWNHTNAIAYNAHLDQIAVSVRGNNEIWIIDHSTTSEEARGHTGGRSGKGGDILYRWGNPVAYRAGSEEDQQLFGQHDIHWIPEGLPGSGNLLMFNNLPGRDDENYSSVVELIPPLQENGTYHIEVGEAYGPEVPDWEYTAPNKEDFFSGHISGAQRQPNGNTLVCEGATGRFFEVTADKKMVWEFVNPAASQEPPEEDEEDDEEPEFRNDVFRVYRYGTDFPGFKGKDLTPGLLMTDYVKAHPPKIAKQPSEDE